ncbi:hypothetical protein DFH28DRAFT_1135037 [Melampsora americana]|nr:hypothetical protein DFH28DRAFT_1135037 [Melampsora americana]
MEVTVPASEIDSDSNSESSEGVTDCSHAAGDCLIALKTPLRQGTTDNESSDSLSSSLSSSEEEGNPVEEPDLQRDTTMNPQSASEEVVNINESELEDMIDTFNEAAYVKKGSKELRDKLRFDWVATTRESASNSINITMQ